MDLGHLISALPARLVTLEGGEGAGKSTLARALAARLAAGGLPVLRTREPGGSPGAEAVRGLLLGRGGWDPMAEAMLVSAARREHVVRTLAPALAAGIWVVCDRFSDSTAAYQGAAGGLGPEACRRLTDFALGELRPDLTLVLDLSVEAGTARALSRGEHNRFEALGPAYHARVRAAFREITAAEPERCVLLDASRPAATVLDAALTILRDRLGAPV